MLSHFVPHVFTDRGADVNAVNSLGDTPLHDAVARGDIDVVEELLRAGANPFIRSIKGYLMGFFLHLLVKITVNT